MDLQEEWICCKLHNSKWLKEKKGGRKDGVEWISKRNGFDANLSAWYRLFFLFDSTVFCIFFPFVI